MAISQSDGSILLKTKVDNTGLKSGLNGITSATKIASKAVLSVVAVASTAIVALTKKAVDAYADYEQLVGGVETLFKDSAETVIEYANEADKTVGISANQYMQTITGFSAALISSLGGDTAKATEIANQALIDMADNANKMGTPLENIQNAYLSFARQQYVLLDNLKLGYGGTKTEMERLLRDAEQITGIEYDISNLADVYNAIHVIQVELGIAGTTAIEAEKTITGSANAMKAAWQNVLTAVAGGGDLDKAIENLVDTVAVYFENIEPVVERALIGIGRLIEKVAPSLMQTVGRALIQSLPYLTAAVYQMIIGLAQGIVDGIIALFTPSVNKALEEQAEKSEEVVNNQAELTNNVKETNKELKKSLAGFDDLQILTTEIAEEDLSTQFTNVSNVPTGQSTLTGSNDNKEVENAITDELARIMTIAGGALLAIGLILLLTGNIPLGLGLIAAGAVSIVSAVTANPDAVKQLFVDIFDSIKKAASDFFNWLVNGINGTLTSFFDFGKQLYNDLYQIFNGIIEFFAGVFTGDFERAWNGIKNIFAGIVNSMITIIENFSNWVINAINGILGGIDVVANAIGGIFGQDWTTTKIPNVNLPRLAQGAVIPANREFLAVLGDQRQGTNIETPLATMVEAFQMALDSRGGGNGQTTVVLEIDGREFGRAVVEQGNKENRRIGTRLVIG